MRVVLLAGGEVRGHERVRLLLGRPDLTLCADSGIRHAAPLGLTPDLVLGDLDSADPAQVAALAAAGVPVLPFPADKDQTDTELALAEAVRRGASEIWLVGGAGGRLDHTLANVLLLTAQPVPVIMVDGTHIARLLQSGESICLTGEAGDTLSLLPLTPAVTGVTVTGVKWPLWAATLRWGETLGVSNQFVAATAALAVAEGTLLVVQAWD